MKWITNFFGSSIGRKLLMSLTGLFLILFLVIHLIGNLQLLANDGGESFNVYAKFMTSNPLIKTVSYGLYFFILLHSVVGLMLWWNNRQAKGQTYAVSNKNPKVSWASKNMALLGTFILAFICIHMGDFWFKMKSGVLGTQTYDATQGPIADLYGRVAEAYTNPVIIAFYVLGMFVLSFHLWHGFQSAFQTLGINHKKYTPLIQGLGKAYAILIPLAFAIIPLYFYFFLR
jgi:succinate dehydrogenase / fumarate reductase, cytochrome b subunit